MRVSAMSHAIYAAFSGHAITSHVQEEENKAIVDFNR
jgi:hypothetical protein